MPKTKCESMSDALQRSDEIASFLNQGKCHKPSARRTREKTEERIAVTVRLPKKLSHALIDASAERRKNRADAWSQQDIVAEAILAWLAANRMSEE